MYTKKQTSKTALYFIYFVSIVFSFAYGVLYYSSYPYLYDNLPITTKNLLEMTYFIMAACGVIHVIASPIGKKIINFKVLLFFALIFQCLGCYLIAFVNIDFIHIGFAIYSVGYGFIVTCVTVFLNYYIEAKETDKSGVKLIFTIDLLCFNLGMLAGAATGLFVIELGNLFCIAFLVCGVAVLGFIFFHDYLILRVKLSDYKIKRAVTFSIVCTLLVLLIYKGFRLNPYFRWTG
ncbi:hypothetical protein [Cysteiniphilum marinum]|uniref:hypothetical protein n=1 Tax=Cysteiniphilum marinum TaxID=2774191 RepID=UPI0019395AEF|nr:hypothetical protein [Cysteiniphilum marinum]